MLSDLRCWLHADREQDHDKEKEDSKRKTTTANGVSMRLYPKSCLDAQGTILGRVHLENINISSGGQQILVSTTVQLFNARNISVDDGSQGHAQMHRFSTCSCWSKCIKKEGANDTPHESCNGTVQAERALTGADECSPPRRGITGQAGNLLAALIEARRLTGSCLFILERREMTAAWATVLGH